MVFEHFELAQSPDAIQIQFGQSSDPVLAPDKFLSGKLVAYVKPRMDDVQTRRPDVQTF